MLLWGGNGGAAGGEMAVKLPVLGSRTHGARWGLDRPGLRARERGESFQFPGPFLLLLKGKYVAALNCLELKWNLKTPRLL